MFTGIIQATGKILEIKQTEGDARFVFDTGKMDLSDMAIGESIAVNGACLTIIDKETHQFNADLSKETLKLTCFSKMQEGSAVNLEKAMQLSERINGHLVSGHIDGIGLIKQIRQDARSTQYDIQVSMALMKYIAKKGSVTVDGVSLTVNETGEDSFAVNIIPHTIKETIFSDYNQGSWVNIEVDLIARYLEQMLTNTDS